MATANWSAKASQSAIETGENAPLRRAFNWSSPSRASPTRKGIKATDSYPSRLHRPG